VDDEQLIAVVGADAQALDGRQRNFQQHLKMLKTIVQF